MGAITEFRQQYGDLHDAVIHSICYEYGGQEANWKKNLTLLISCLNRSRESLEQDAWDTLKIALLDVQAFRFDEPNNFINQITYKVDLLFDRGEYYFDFDSVNGDNPTVEEISESKFFIRCRDFSYEVVNAL